MKKILLMALLLGLTGCGENNQSDSIKTDTQPIVSNQREALNSQAPIQSSRSAIAPSLMGWTVNSTSPLGSGLIIDAEKLGVSSSALIKPTSADVAKVLRGGAAGIALSIAVDQLLGAVDWVLDPENSRIKYKQKPNQINYLYQLDVASYSNSDVYFRPTTGAVISDFYTYINDLNNHYGYNLLNYSNARVADLGEGNFELRYDGYQLERDGSKYNFCTRAPNGYCVIRVNIKPVPPEEKTLPLETVAEQVISNADNESLDAQVATGLAAQSILNEAYNDDAKAEPIVNELENNARNNCPSGITNNGSCWVCSRESWMPIRSRVVYAKEVVFGLNKCSVAMNSSQLLTRYKAYSELGAARDAENACWSPQDPEHLDEAIKAKATAAECNTYLGVLGQ